MGHVTVSGQGCVLGGANGRVWAWTKGRGGVPVETMSGMSRCRPLSPYGAGLPLTSDEGMLGWQQTGFSPQLQDQLATWQEAFQPGRGAVVIGL